MVLVCRVGGVSKVIRNIQDHLKYFKSSEKNIHHNYKF